MSEVRQLPGVLMTKEEDVAAYELGVEIGSMDELTLEQRGALAAKALVMKLDSNDTRGKMGAAELRALAASLERIYKVTLTHIRQIADTRDTLA